MNTNSQEYREAARYGKSLLGKYAQSTILTMMSNSGKYVMQPAYKITSFEIVEMFCEPTLMVTISGESVLESTLINIHS